MEYKSGETVAFTTRTAAYDDHSAETYHIEAKILDASGEQIVKQFYYTQKFLAFLR